MAEIQPTRVEFQDFPSVGGTTSPRRRARMLVDVTGVTVQDTVSLAAHNDIAAIESTGIPMVDGVSPAGGTTQIAVNGTVITLGTTGAFIIDCVIRYT